MSIILGSSPPIALYAGDSPIVRRYAGEDLIWQSQQGTSVEWNQHVVNGDFYENSGWTAEQTGGLLIARCGIIRISTDRAKNIIYQDIQSPITSTSSFYLGFSARSYVIDATKPHQAYFGIGTSRLAATKKVSISDLGNVFKRSTALVINVSDKFKYFVCQAAPANGDVDGATIVDDLIAINLTQMYGAGNEPDKQEFERQCALNGIDLSTYQPYNAGTIINNWRV